MIDVAPVLMTPPAVGTPTSFARFKVLIALAKSRGCLSPNISSALRVVNGAMA
jgi:hypothetical protein